MHPQLLLRINHRPKRQLSVASLREYYFYFNITNVNVANIDNANITHITPGHHYWSS